MILDKRLTPARSDLADERLRGLVDAARFVTGSPRRVVAPSAPLRREPYPDAALDTEALMGEPVTVFDEREGQAWVQLGRDGYVGYLPSEALGQDGPEPTHRVAALRTFIYPGPDLKIPPIGHLSFGAGVTPLEERAGYARISTGGWVFARHLVPDGSRANDFVDVAEGFLHAPYLWGGKTSLGLDCSGLVQIALAATGVAAPRDTDMQAGALGRALATDGAHRRGDLVFWGGHVGIMLDDTRLLHANAHHMAVAIEPLAEATSRIAGGGGGPLTVARRLA